MSYEWNASSGVDGTGCLAIGSQTVTDGLESPVELNDMLVTPALGGAASLDVKAMNYGSTISFWYVNYEDGKFTTDGQIDMTVPELTQDGFVRVDIPEMPEGTLIGIRGNSVYIDNFKADMAEVTPYPRMRVNGFRRLGGQYVDTKADGKFTLSYKVAVENTGQRDLTAAPVPRVSVAVRLPRRMSQKPFRPHRRRRARTQLPLRRLPPLLCPRRPLYGLDEARAPGRAAPLGHRGPAAPRPALLRLTPFIYVFSFFGKTFQPFSLSPFLIENHGGTV